MYESYIFCLLYVPYEHYDTREVGGEKEKEREEGGKKVGFWPICSRSSPYM